MGGGNPYPFGSKEWQQHNDVEVASRPTARLVRKPFIWPDGITIKFLESVPGHSAGEVATISAARAREYLAEKQAEIAS